MFFRAGDLHERAGLAREEALALPTAFHDQCDDRPRDPFDVPVWRPSGEDHPAWPSPWGWGRPGWHAECAAMAWATLGTSVDVLVGGQDLAYPHHAYQAAMVEAASGVAPFARRQLHVGLVSVNGAKMAKSTGNLVLVEDLLAKHSPAALRLLLLNRPWAEPWDYDEAELPEAAALLERLYAAAGTAGGGDAGGVLDALVADLDVPGAVSAALAGGGEAARLLLRVLGLSDATTV